MPLVRRNLGVTSGIGGGPGPSQPAVTAAQTGQVEDLQQSSQQPTGNAGQRVPKDEASQPPLELSQQSVLPASSQKQVERSQQEAQVQPLAGEPSIAANIGEAVDAGKLPIMLPERLNRNKVLLELPSAPASGEQYHGAADLSGDSGAVGRIVVLGSGASGKGAAAADGSGLQLQVDLKGVLYNAWVLPLATTAMVLNIGPTEAKVESLFNDFIRLREAVDPYGSDEDGGDAGLAYLLDGDDENYQRGGTARATMRRDKVPKSAKPRVSHARGPRTRRPAEAQRRRLRPARRLLRPRPTRRTEARGWGQKGRRPELQRKKSQVSRGQTQKERIRRDPRRQRRRRRPPRKALQKRRRRRQLRVKGWGSKLGMSRSGLRRGPRSRPHLLRLLQLRSPQAKAGSDAKMSPKTSVANAAVIVGAAAAAAAAAACISHQRHMYRITRRQLRSHGPVPGEVPW
ncbi:hypothetical protein Vretimale_5514 [Volvox reticuliferus]|uniref:Uncharacterized protein n=1 Tax=Volvox reticuliferus TaxID=1737510 RepID=A0A8J4G5X5_9CHLO|nr:hypothetical protein Vretifemale_5571 [Volvox reticuliferus]GIM00651.1 hypothetical protein Vretimale_5514 [Volvox reticuliferus]